MSPCRVAGLLVVIAVSSLTCPLARGWADTAVTTCGQQVKGRAFLTGDLDCTGFTGDAVTMVGGTLSLNGFTLTGGDLTGVTCTRSCKIVGPGTITGSGAFGANSFGTIRLSNVDVTNNGYAGVQCFKTCTIDGPGTISGNGGQGVRGGTGASVRNVTISGNVGAGMEMANNAGTAKAKVRGTTITTNGSGIDVDLVASIRDSTVTGNARDGVNAGVYDCSRHGAIMLRNSTVTGNGTDPACGVSIACADLASCLTPPSVGPNSTCDTSHQSGSGVPGDDWDVCSLD